MLPHISCPIIQKVKYLGSSVYIPFFRSFVVFKLDHISTPKVLVYWLQLEVYCSSPALSCWASVRVSLKHVAFMSNRRAWLTSTRILALHALLRSLGRHWNQPHIHSSRLQYFSLVPGTTWQCDWCRSNRRCRRRRHLPSDVAEPLPQSWLGMGDSYPRFHLHWSSFNGQSLYPFSTPTKAWWQRLARL